MSKHRTRILMAFALALATAACLAEDRGIAATSAADGRTIFINSSDTPHSPKLDTHSTDPRVEGSGARVRYVYWSNTEHRWKPVPGQSAAVRRARSAAAEALLVTADANAAPAQSSNDVDTFFSAAKLDDAIQQAATRHNVDPDLVRAVIKVESNFNPHAVSRKGAMGLMQLMPETARQLNVMNPFDPKENVDAGVRHLRQLLDSFGGNVPMSLAAYNAGARAVTQHNGVPPYRETQNYVRQITSLYKTGELMGEPVRHPIRVSRDAEGHLLFSNTE